MRKIIVLSASLISVNALFSQAGSSTLSMSQDFSQLARPATSGSSAYQSYSTDQVNGSQFFLQDWHKGQILTNHKELFAQGLLLSYDKVRQELFLKKDESSTILLGDKDGILSFSLNDGDKQYNFINSAVFSDEKPKVYYQLLVYDSSKLSLLKLTKTTFVKADKEDVMRVQSGDVYDAFVDKYYYFIVKGKGIPQSIQFKYKSLKKTFTDLNVNPDKYMDEHGLSIDEDYLIDMVKQLNR